jgi:hypothetical protein
LCKNRKFSIIAPLKAQNFIKFALYKVKIIIKIALREVQFLQFQWIYDFTYAVFDGERVELKYFGNNQGI